MPIELLPERRLSDSGPCSNEFLEQKCATFREAAALVRKLPFGRNTGRPTWKYVLNDGRGTCSSKHLLISALANELELSVALVLGVYEMNESNTPGVGAILGAHGLSAIPEAHCWLQYNGHSVDLTSPGAGKWATKRVFFHTEIVMQNQIEEHKIKVHQGLLAEWLKQNPELNLTLADIWAIRESCIEALSAHTAGNSHATAHFRKEMTRP